MCEEDLIGSQGLIPSVTAGAGAPKEQPYRVKELLCRRTGAWLPLDEHKQCPYCFGRAEDVETGLHARFCGYDPARDPVHFGFPGGTARDLEG